MKHKILVSVILLLLYSTVSGLLQSCYREKAIHHIFKWPSSGNSDADSLTVALESSFAYGYWSKVNKVTDTSRDSLLIRLDSIARKNPDNFLVNLRSDYYKCIDLSLSDLKQASLMMDSCLVTLDSVRYEYDFNKWKTLKAFREKDLLKQYLNFNSLLRYFEKANDQFEVARINIDLGNIMYDLNDTVNALSYISKAEEIGDKYLLHAVSWMAKLNKSNMLTPSGKDSLLALLRKDRLITDPDGNKYFKSLVFENSFVSSDSLVFINKALDIYDTTLYDNSPRQNYLKAWHFYHKGLQDSTVIYFKRAAANIYPGYKTNRISPILYCLGDIYWHEQKYDSAALAYKNACFWKDSTDKEQNITKLYNSHIKNILSYEQKIAQHKNINLAYIFIIVIIFIIFIFLRLYSNRRYNALLAEERLKRYSQNLATYKLIVEEKDRLIFSIEKRISELRGDNLCDDTNLAEISRLLKMHKGAASERQNLVRIQEGISSVMISNLKKDFPELTESQLRLSALLVAGADTQQISQILNIGAASVNTNRYRLRKKLRLSKEQGLEDFLRNYLLSGDIGSLPPS